MKTRAKRKASPGKRKIHIDGQVWTYTVGRQHVKVCDPKGAKTYVLYLGDRDADPRITPSRVSDAIKIECLGIPARKVQHERTMISRRENLERWEKMVPGILGSEVKENYMRTGVLGAIQMEAIVLHRKGQEE